MRKNALILICAFVVSIFAIFIYYAYDEMSQKTRTIAYSMATYAASNYSQSVEKKFEELFIRGDMLHDGLQVYSGDMGKSEKALLEHLLKASVCEVPEVHNAWIYFVKEKAFFLGCQDAGNGENFQRRKIIQEEGIYEKANWISEPFEEVGSGKKLITFVIPFLHDGEKRGLIGFEVDLMTVHQIIASHQELGFGYLTVISEEGKIALHPDEKCIGRSIKEYAEFETYKQSLQADSSRISPIITSDYLEVPVLHIYSPLKLTGAMDWKVVVSVPVFNFMDTPEHIRKKLVGVGVISVILLLLVLYFALGRWQKEFNRRLEVEEEKRNLELQNEKIERENIQAQLENLKNQLNPHFLFNSLSSLFSLVERDKELARKFVIKLSKLYRNLLLKNQETLSTVGDEAGFTEHYLFLQKIRFGDALSYRIEIDQDDKGLYIPTHSLITLVENAIKHNIVTRESPLKIDIQLEKQGLMVINNYNPNHNKKDKLGTGLKNLASRYSLMGGCLPEAHIEEDLYIACLPILKG